MMEVTALHDGRSWQIGDTTFVFDYGRDSAPDRFLIRKPPDLLELYVDLAAGFQGAAIVELGIAAGGGTALLALLAEPRALIACELDVEPVAALTSFIDARGLESVVMPHYGVDQADRQRLAGIIDSAIPEQRLDLVIDDASHLYEPTRASFEVLFPRLRPGGLYIIEDWAADYAYAKRIAATLDGASPRSAALEARLAEAAAEHPDGRPTPLPRLGVELLHACGDSGDVVRELRINQHWLVVERGPTELASTPFRLSDHVTDPWSTASE
jgi:predicted O-methyltransferase YrrM